MKQVVVKRLSMQEDSTLNRQFKDFAGFYGYKPVLCRPYRGQTKGKVERTVQFVRDHLMIGIKYDSLNDLNGQALAWCNKVNGKVHATTNEIPFSNHCGGDMDGGLRPASSRTPAVSILYQQNTLAEMWQS